MAINNPYNYSMPKNVMNRRVSKANTISSTSKSTSTNKVDHYLEQKVMSAKPEELTYLLYEGMIKFLKQAKIFLEDKNLQKSHDSLVKAQNIISELRSTLDTEIEISKNLDDLYAFMYDTLISANINKSEKDIDNVIELATELKDTWKQAMDQLK